jgi:hypothetical protein
VAAVAVTVWQGGCGWMTLAVDVTGVFEWSDLEQYWPRYVCFGGGSLAGGWQWLGGSGWCGGWLCGSGWCRGWLCGSCNDSGVAVDVAGWRLMWRWQWSLNGVIRSSIDRDMCVLGVVGWHSGCGSWVAVDSVAAVAVAVWQCSNCGSGCVLILMWRWLWSLNGVNRSSID